MRYLFALRLPFIAAFGMALSSPALATGGLFCSKQGDAKAPALSLVIGHGYPGAVVGATLIDGERELSTMGKDPPLLLVQAWVDRKQILIDLSDAEAMDRVVLLTARTINAEGEAAGTLVYKGRKYAVRCEESG
jgi:hypothetical protein